MRTKKLQHLARFISTWLILCLSLPTSPAYALREIQEGREESEKIAHALTSVPSTPIRPELSDGRGAGLEEAQKVRPLKISSGNEISWRQPFFYPSGLLILQGKDQIAVLEKDGIRFGLLRKDSKADRPLFEWTGKFTETEGDYAAVCLPPSSSAIDRPELVVFDSNYGSYYKLTLEHSDAAPLFTTGLGGYDGMSLGAAFDAGQGILLHLTSFAGRKRLYLYNFSNLRDPKDITEKTERGVAFQVEHFEAMGEPLDFIYDPQLKQILVLHRDATARHRNFYVTALRWHNSTRRFIRDKWGRVPIDFFGVWRLPRMRVAVDTSSPNTYYLFTDPYHQELLIYERLIQGDNIFFTPKKRLQLPGDYQGSIDALEVPIAVHPETGWILMADLNNHQVLVLPSVKELLREKEDQGFTIFHALARDGNPKNSANPSPWRKEDMWVKEVTPEGQLVLRALLEPSKEIIGAAVDPRGLEPDETLPIDWRPISQKESARDPQQIEEGPWRARVQKVTERASTRLYLELELSQESGSSLKSERIEIGFKGRAIHKEDQIRLAGKVELGPSPSRLRLFLLVEDESGFNPILWEAVAVLRDGSLTLEDEASHEITEEAHLNTVIADHQGLPLSARRTRTEIPKQWGWKKEALEEGLLRLPTHFSPFSTGLEEWRDPLDQLNLEKKVALGRFYRRALATKPIHEGWLALSRLLRRNPTTGELLATLPSSIREKWIRKGGFTRFSIYRSRMYISLKKAGLDWWLAIESRQGTPLSVSLPVQITPGELSQVLQQARQDLEELQPELPKPKPQMQKADPWYAQLDRLKPSVQQEWLAAVTSLESEAPRAFEVFLHCLGYQQQYGRWPRAIELEGGMGTARQNIYQLLHIVRQRFLPLAQKVPGLMIEHPGRRSPKVPILDFNEEVRRSLIARLKEFHRPARPLRQFPQPSFMPPPGKTQKGSDPIETLADLSEGEWLFDRYGRSGVVLSTHGEGIDRTATIFFWGEDRWLSRPYRERYYGKVYNQTLRPEFRLRWTMPAPVSVEGASEHYDQLHLLLRTLKATRSPEEASQVVAAVLAWFKKWETKTSAQAALRKEIELRLRGALARLEEPLRERVGEAVLEALQKKTAGESLREELICLSLPLVSRPERQEQLSQAIEELLFHKKGQSAGQIERLLPEIFHALPSQMARDVLEQLLRSPLGERTGTQGGRWADDDQSSVARRAAQELLDHGYGQLVSALEGIDSGIPAANKRGIDQALRLHEIVPTPEEGREEFYEIVADPSRHVFTVGTTQVPLDEGQDDFVLLLKTFFGQLRMIGRISIWLTRWSDRVEVDLQGRSFQIDLLQTDLSQNPVAEQVNGQWLPVEAESTRFFVALAALLPDLLNPAARDRVMDLDLVRLWLLQDAARAIPPLEVGLGRPEEKMVTGVSVKLSPTGRRLIKWWEGLTPAEQSRQRSVKEIAEAAGIHVAVAYRLRREVNAFLVGQDKPIIQIHKRGRPPGSKPTEPSLSRAIAKGPRTGPASVSVPPTPDQPASVVDLVAPKPESPAVAPVAAVASPLPSAVLTYAEAQQEIRRLADAVGAIINEYAVRNPYQLFTSAQQEEKRQEAIKKLTENLERELEGEVQLSRRHFKLQKVRHIRHQQKVARAAPTDEDVRDQVRELVRAGAVDQAETLSQVSKEALEAIAVKLFGLSWTRQQMTDMIAEVERVVRTVFERRPISVRDVLDALHDGMDLEDRALVVEFVQTELAERPTPTFYGKVPGQSAGLEEGTVRLKGFRKDTGASNSQVSVHYSRESFVRVEISRERVSVRANNPKDHTYFSVEDYVKRSEGLKAPYRRAVITEGHIGDSKPSRETNYSGFGRPEIPFLEVVDFRQPSEGNSRPTLRLTFRPRTTIAEESFPITVQPWGNPRGKAEALQVEIRRSQPTGLEEDLARAEGIVARLEGLLPRVIQGEVEPQRFLDGLKELAEQPIYNKPWGPLASFPAIQFLLRFSLQQMWGLTRLLRDEPENPAWQEAAKGSIPELLSATQGQVEFLRSLLPLRKDNRFLRTQNTRFIEDTLHMDKGIFNRLFQVHQAQWELFEPVGSFPLNFFQKGSHGVYAETNLLMAPRLLAHAGVREGTRLLDLGSGAGSVLAVASGVFQAKAYGFEINHALAESSRRWIGVLQERSVVSPNQTVQILEEDFLKADWPEADVLYYFLRGTKRENELLLRILAYGRERPVRLILYYGGEGVLQNRDAKMQHLFKTSGWQAKPLPGLQTTLFASALAQKSGLEEKKDDEMARYQNMLWFRGHILAQSHPQEVIEFLNGLLKHNVNPWEPLVLWYYAGLWKQLSQEQRTAIFEWLVAHTEVIPSGIDAETLFKDAAETEPSPTREAAKRGLEALEMRFQDWTSLSVESLVSRTKRHNLIPVADFRLIGIPAQMQEFSLDVKNLNFYALANGDPVPALLTHRGSGRRYFHPRVTSLGYEASHALLGRLVTADGLSVGFRIDARSGAVSYFRSTGLEEKKVFFVTPEVAWMVRYIPEGQTFRVFLWDGQEPPVGVPSGTVFPLGKKPQDHSKEQKWLQSILKQEAGIFREISGSRIILVRSIENFTPDFLTSDDDQVVVNPMDRSSAAKALIELSRHKGRQSQNLDVEAEEVSAHGRML